MNNTLTAREAAALLGISLPTLYSYVSRGLLQSQQHPGQKAKRYAKEEVLRLLARASDNKRAGSAAESAIDWGLPVLESKITQVANGKLYYRAHAVDELAVTHTLEQTAWVLWDSEAGPDLPQTCLTALTRLWPTLPGLTAHLSPYERAISILPLLARTVEEIQYIHAHQKAMLWMHLSAAALLGIAPDYQAFHQKLAAAWQLNAEQAELVRAALVVSADHELNVSTFTVRCVASAGANMGMALVAGLAALSGPKHGGESLRVSRLLRAALAVPENDISSFLARHLRSHDASHHFSPRLPGFAHPLYPDGDPRGALLMKMLDREKHASLFVVAEIAEDLTSQKLNIDFGLVAVEIACQLPPGAAQILFALGRTAGWLAHAMEQLETGQLIRPRARYVGKFPDTATD
ncbi:citrate/2-methylcitrate synthase [Undibacterium sp. Di27W]|uniref:citrate/2-methylcitrate synthase n=1 Tax=Undibacterium sp. Di27W TaxID=3413036 RepID=UPI003BF18A56